MEENKKALRISYYFINQPSLEQAGQLDLLTFGVCVFWKVPVAAPKIAIDPSCSAVCFSLRVRLPSKVPKFSLM